MQARGLVLLLELSDICSSYPQGLSHGSFGLVDVLLVFQQRQSKSWERVAFGLWVSFRYAARRSTLLGSADWISCNNMILSYEGLYQTVRADDSRRPFSHGGPSALLRRVKSVSFLQELQPDHKFSSP